MLDKRFSIYKEAKNQINRFLSAAQPSKMVKSSNPEERRIQMRQYELILIVQPDLDEEARNAVVDRVKDMITTNNGQILKLSLIHISEPTRPY